MVHETRYFVCRICGKKAQKRTPTQYLCKECRVDENLKMRGKKYQEEVERLQKEDKDGSN